MGERGRPRQERRPGGGRRHAAPRDEPRIAGAEPPGGGEPPLRPPGPGRAARRRAARRIKRRRRLRATREIPILIGSALLIALVLKTFLVQAFVIPSGSMERTIQIDDRVLVDKLSPWFGWEPERGEVVVFRDPGGWLSDEPRAETEEAPFGIRHIQAALTWIGLMPTANDQDLIKRVIGVGGDTVACCDEQGRVTVNGEPLDEPYLFPGNIPSQETFEVHVPEGRIFVMGDHRLNSADSRAHLEEPGQGTIPVDLVVGRAVVVAWPFAHWQRLDGTETFSAVPDPGASDAEGTRAAGASGGAAGGEEVARPPIPAELPLVMGVVGLSRRRRGPERSVRSECGGCGCGCAVRCGGPRGGPRDAGRRGIRRGIPRLPPLPGTARWRERGRGPRGARRVRRRGKPP